MLAGCFGMTFADDRRETLSTERGFVKGTVTDAAGKPLAGVRIIIDQSIFYDSNITATTDARGNYRVKIPNGSWHAFAQMRKNFGGKTFTFYLEPDRYEGFGGEGAVRNFVWKLTGEKREPLAAGFFGGTITFDKAVGAPVIESREIEFTLKPLGSLIDGSEGETRRVRSNDGYQIDDVPIGRYEISATYRGRAVGLRRFNTDGAYAKTLTIDFEPQIAGFCDNCVKLEYE